jgi:hypothetical protein
MTVFRCSQQLLEQVTKRAKHRWPFRLLPPIQRISQQVFVQDGFIIEELLAMLLKNP